MRIIDRFDLYMKYKRLNDNKVTTQLCLSNGVIGKSRKIGRDLSDRVIEQILNFYTDLNKTWLLTGEGEMLRSGESLLAPVFVTEGESVVRVIPTEARGGTIGDFSTALRESEAANFETILSPIKGCDWAITIYGDSMAPDYPSGSKVLIKKINEKAFIEWGREYVLDTENGPIIKEIQPSQREGHVWCVSRNEKYKPFEIDTRHIIGWYRVLMVLSMK